MNLFPEHSDTFPQMTNKTIRLREHQCSALKRGELDGQFGMRVALWLQPQFYNIISVDAQAPRQFLNTNFSFGIINGSAVEREGVLEIPVRNKTPDCYPRYNQELSDQWKIFLPYDGRSLLNLIEPAQTEIVVGIKEVLQFLERENIVRESAGIQNPTMFVLRAICKVDLSILQIGEGRELARTSLKDLWKAYQKNSDEWVVLALHAIGEVP